MTNEENGERHFPVLFVWPSEVLKFGYVRVGLYDQHGAHLPIWPVMISADSRFPTARRRWRELPQARVATRGGYVFAGAYYPAFGHFLTETLVNLLAAAPLLRAFPDRRVLCLLPSPGTERRVFSGAHERVFLDMLGLDPDRIEFATSPAGYCDVIVPPAPFLGKFTYDPRILPALDAFGPGATGATGRLYLSRSRWPKPRVLDETRIEAQFAQAGYQVVHLQDLSLSDQIAAIRGASDLAGPQGTALHWSLFARNVRSVISLGWKSDLQAGICKARGQAYENPRGRIVSLGNPRLRAVRPARVVRSIDRISARTGDA